MSNPFSPVVVDAMRGANASRRFMILAGLALAIAVIAGLTMYAGTTEWVTLYSGLDPAEAGQITDALQKASIRTQLGAGGSEVQVAGADRARAVVAAAKEGLPTRGARPGEELWDKKQAWGLSELEQRITYRRGLEGELARTIGAIRGVERAQVHLVLTEQSAIRKLERPAEAAVLLTLSRGASLTPDAVQGIALLVSHSVENLPSDHVAVMDSEGHLLSVPTENGLALGFSSRQLDQQHGVEKALADKAEALLTAVLGMGQARVQVAARLNLDQVDKTTTSYNPDGAVLANEQHSEVTGDTVEGGGGTSTIVNNTYQNSVSVEKMTGATGGIGRLTIAVLVNEKALDKVQGAAGQPLSHLEELVKSAIGFDSIRGDRITVTAIPFEPSGLVAAGLADSGRTESVPVMIYVERFSRPMIGLIGILGALLLAFKVLRPAPTAAPYRMAGASAGAGSMAPPMPEPELPPVHVNQLTAVTTKLRQQVASDSAARPETAAQVIKTWMAEG
jgi:flagellar M-ring protein FliF